LLKETRRGAIPKRQADLNEAWRMWRAVRENARILGGVHAPQVEAMAKRVVELEGRVTQLRQRLAELMSEADAFEAAAKT
jgi:hypothetical protein